MAARPKSRLLDLEYQILEASIALERDAEPVYGFALAKWLASNRAGRDTLIGHGTLYKALARLVKMGMLSARWEELVEAGRPRRRLYDLTPDGVRAHAAMSSGVRPLALKGRLA